MNPYPSASFSPTANPITSSTAFAIVNQTAAQAANPAFLQAEFASDPATDAGGTAVYIVLGVGARNSMIGSVMQNAPLSVSQKSSFTPDNTYSRVGLIFKVDGIEVQKSERARFIAAVALEDDELETTEKDTVGYYGVSTDPSLTSTSTNSGS
jgi:hypothetical protein